MLCTNLVVKQLYTDVQLLNSLFQKAYGKGIIPYVPLLKILNVPERTGRPWFHAAAMFLWNKNSPSMRPWRDGVLISSEFCARTKLVFSRHTRMYVGKKCTRRYTSGQSIFKRLTERLFYYVATPLKTPLRIRR